MAYTSSEYGDIFCTAVQNIVKQSIGQLEFDVSKECTIIKINDKAYGKYQLSDGSVSFEGIAGEGATYEVGDRVIATIPKGDYNQQISILTKVIDEWSGPAGWVRPLDTLMRCTGNIAFTAHSAALPANGDQTSQEVFKITEQQFLGFEKIGITAKFKSLLAGQNVIEGSYGLQVILESNDKIHICELSQDLMLGNPYEFQTYFAQEYVFTLPKDFNNIDSISINFYQKKDFKNGNGVSIEANNNYSTLLVKDIELYFGYDISKSAEEIVRINCDSLSYDLKNNTKNISLTWFHKLDGSTMKQIQKNDVEEGKYQVRWYQYSPGCTEDEKDKYGGDNWKWINKTRPNPAPENYPFIITGEMRSIRTSERFKAICFVETHPLINDETYIVWEQYPSNELSFENTEEETLGGEQAEEIIKRDLALVFRDNSYGNYYIYDQNNDFLDSKDSKERVLELTYLGESINEDNRPPVNITNIKWHLPNGNTMLIWDKSKSWEGPNQYTFIYHIKSSYDYSLNDNTIRCSIYTDEVLVDTVQEDLRFGKQGSNGTGNTFILEMLDGKNAICLEDKTDVDENTYAGLKVQAILIRESGKRFYFTDEEAEKINWELINNCGIVMNNSNTDTITLTYNNDTIPNNNYTILKASYKYGDGENDPVLEAYLPIAMKLSNNYTYLIGCKQILYNHQGKPKYDNGTYVVKSVSQNNDEQIIIEYNTCYLKQEDNNPNPVSLKDQQGGKGISASALFTKGSKKDSNDKLLEIQDKICVYCTNNNEIIWSQPILIMQTQYDFAMLNSWDGTLTLDEKNGTILSTMLGAGRKNEQNQFSGVLIGDIQGGTELNDTETLTGVYGLQNGIITYGLREDGTAFFGAYNNGRIEIDGTSGIIRSAGWEKNEKNEWILNNPSGSLFDLTNGIIRMEHGNNYIKIDSQNGFRIKSSQFDLNSGDWNTGKVILTNTITNNQPYFFGVGTTNSYIRFSRNNGLEIKTDSANISLGNITLETTLNGIKKEISDGDNANKSLIEQTADAIRSEVSSGDNANKSLIDQNASAIAAKVSSEGGNASFGWELKSTGFFLNSQNKQVFKCDSTGVSINGGGTFSGTLSAANGTFAGDLSADTTKFNKIEAGAVKIGGKEYYSSFANGEIKLVVGTEDAEGTTNGHGGYFKVGPANETVYNQYWDDITIWGEVIKEDLTQTGYGNIGTPTRQWSWMYVAHDGSQRNMKRNIQRYDSEQAYEELRHLPLYTYQYIGDSDHTRSLFLGSMIDYMPIEFMRTTPEKDGTIFEPNNIIFWNIAASQTMQSKLEDLINRVEQLEQKEV